MLNNTTDSKTIQDEISKTDIKIFESEEFGNITAIEKDGEPWFVAKDLADILGYTTTEKMTRRLEKDEKANILWRGSPSNVTQKTVINESGLYEAIFGSHMPKAKAFRKWVKTEVLPSIRKTGQYKHIDKPKAIVKSPTRSKVASDLAANIRIAKLFGLEGNQALLSANMMISKQYKEFGVNPLLESGVELVSEKKIQYFTPTSLGNQIGGVSPSQVNQMLAEAGMQEETRGPKNKLIWKILEKGKPFCEMIDTGKTHNGAPIMQVKWCADVLKIDS